MQSLNKKAATNIIATVFLILLSMLAIILVFLSLNKLINTAQLSPKFSCVEMQISSTIEIQNACYNSDNNNIEATIKRDISTEINYLEFILVSPSGNSEKWTTLNCEKSELQNKGETKTYELFLNAFEENSEIKVLISDCLLDSKEINSYC